jgi:hypothetical protein
VLKVGGAALLALGIAAFAASVAERAPAPAATARAATVPFPPEARLLAEAARVPEHVQTLYYFGFDSINYDVPAGVMARYADFVEDGDHGEFAARFKAAGGRYALAYDDPVYVPYCVPPFKPPAGPCDQEFSHYIKDESGWFHGPDGARVHRYVPNDKKYYEAVNPASPAARRAWREFTAVVKRRAPAIDFIMSDDSGGTLRFGDNGPKSSLFWDFNEAGVEIQRDLDYRDAMIAYLSEAALPLIINGGDPNDTAAYGGAFVRLPFVRGNIHEACYRDDAGVRAFDRGWKYRSDAMLANIALRRWSFCYMDGPPRLERRLYALASWWLVYDPQWTVAAPIQHAAKSSLLPEYSIVPRFPSRTAVTHVEELQAPTGAFAREFGGCYQERRFIGGCATVVNPTTLPVAMPPLAGRYRHALELRGDDVLAGGTYAWVVRTPPAALPPTTAVVLLR